MVVALDAGDERTAKAVDGEAAGDLEGFTSADVRRDVLIRHLGEVDRRLCAVRPTPSGGGVDDAVTSDQNSRSPSHRLPARGRVGCVGRFAQSGPVKVEDGVAADDHTSLRLRKRRDGLCFRARQFEGQPGWRGCGVPVLIDAGDDHCWIQPCGAKGGEPGRAR